MKKILTTLLLLGAITSSAFAAPKQDLAMRSKGFYTTLGVGFAHTQYAQAIAAYQSSLADALIDAFVFGGLAEPSNTHFAGRLSVGYAWDKYFSTELSYYYFGGASYQGGYENGGNLGNDSLSEDYNASQDALAAAVVGRLPLVGASDVYVKAGMAYTWATMNIAYDSTTGSGPYWAPGQRHYSGHFKAASVAPLLGLGWEYNFGQHWALSVGWTKVFVLHRKSFGDPLKTKLGSASLFNVGGTYKF